MRARARPGSWAGVQRGPRREGGWREEEGWSGNGRQWKGRGESGVAAGRPAAAAAAPRRRGGPPEGTGVTPRGGPDYYCSTACMFRCRSLWKYACLMDDRSLLCLSISSFRTPTRMW